MSNVELHRLRKLKQELLSIIETNITVDWFHDMPEAEFRRMYDFVAIRFDEIIDNAEEENELETTNK